MSEMLDEPVWDHFKRVISTEDFEVFKYFAELALTTANEKEEEHDDSVQSVE